MDTVRYVGLGEKMKFMQRMVGLGLMGLMGVSLASAQTAAPAKPGEPTPPQVAAPMGFTPIPAGEMAPDFKAFTPDGKEVSLSQFKGKVVILDFWASWCGPCQVSMPGLEKIYKQVKDKNVVVLSLDTWDQKPDFLSWVKENSGTKYHFNFVRDPAEGDHAGIRKASIAKRLYKVVGIPTMYVIDAEGKVAASFIGSGNETSLAKALGQMGFKVTTP